MRYIITILLLLISTLSHSQVSPINDTTWLLQDNLSDEFNANKLDRTKWRHPEYNWGNYGFYYYRFHPNNAYLSNGELLLMADTSNLNTPPYYSGGIQTKDTVYSYGYYEIRAKLPAYTHNNSPCGKGFWPAFWTYYQPHYDSCLIEHDEIDILEPSGYEFEDASTNVMGLVYRNDDEIGIDYISIIPILVAKINEQNNAINYLLAKSHADQHDIETADNTFHIIECYPNPFNQTTTIKYNLPDDVYNESISIYNRFGNLVNYYDILDKYGQIICDGTSMDAGLYICTFATDGEIHEVKTIIKKDL
ncbi:MAG: family 16 glycosylhydrolase [Bacteroidales bacterium]|nr:family 16 glycosylhydrolase [Bacteroidales bacterium]